MKTYRFITIDPVTRSIKEHSADFPDGGFWSHLGRAALGLPLDSHRAGPADENIGVVDINGKAVSLMTYRPENPWRERRKFKIDANFTWQYSDRTNTVVIALTSTGAGNSSLDPAVTVEDIQKIVSW